MTTSTRTVVSKIRKSENPASRQIGHVTKVGSRFLPYLYSRKLRIENSQRDAERAIADKLGSEVYAFNV